EQIVRWNNMGFETDPAKVKREIYEKLSFEDIAVFYKNNLQTKPVVICIVGDKKSIDMTELGKYGKIVEVKEASLFGK
ncbi:MAG: hypothetical protein GX879_03590, partial [Bacteroidales bacterium]|nr:hypothetical protein [Bacteroidales bacterium]